MRRGLCTTHDQSPSALCLGDPVALARSTGPIKFVLIQSSLAKLFVYPVSGIGSLK